MTIVKAWAVPLFGGFVGNILVIDDDPVIRMAVRRMLEPAGFTIDELGDGREAAGVVRSHPIDLILCDMFMPEKAGIDVIREFAREFPGVKVVAMTGGGFGGWINLLADALRLGAAGVVSKPFEQADLLRAVRGALGPRP